jgi:23S rRNA pseudouridine2605 synthase
MPKPSGRPPRRTEERATGRTPPSGERRGSRRRDGSALTPVVRATKATPSVHEEGERLQKTLARTGYGSRRAAEELIRDGRVTVNGKPAELGRRVSPARDRIAVDGVPVPADPELRYLALNKPPGVTSTLRDPHAARTIADILPPGPRIFPVGRLDRESEGLMLLTNDGTLASRLQHPRYGVEKEYLVDAAGAIGPDRLRDLTRGVQLEDGPARALRARRVQGDRSRAAVAMVMVEGRKREIRRMFAALGLPVRRLVRVRLGPIRLGGLAPGGWRDLEPGEVAALYRAAGLIEARSGPPRTPPSRSRGAPRRRSRSPERRPQP